jgi:hypothetical protein
MDKRVRRDKGGEIGLISEARHAPDNEKPGESGGGSATALNQSHPLEAEEAEEAAVASRRLGVSARIPRIVCARDAYSERRGVEGRRRESAASRAESRSSAAGRLSRFLGPGYFTYAREAHLLRIPALPRA